MDFVKPQVALELGDYRIPGLESYSDTDWLLPLPVCTGLSNLGQESIYVAFKFIFYIDTVDPKYSHILSAYHKATQELMSSLYEAQSQVATLLDKYTNFVDSGQTRRQGVHEQIRIVDTSFGAVREAIKASEDQILSSERFLISALRSAYESHSIVPRFIPWLGKPSKGTLIYEALPSSILEIVDRLHVLEDCLDTYEAHLRHMNLQLLEVPDDIVTTRLKLLAQVIRWSAYPFPTKLNQIEHPDPMFGVSPRWAFPNLRWVEGDIIKSNDIEIVTNPSIDQYLPIS